MCGRYTIYEVDDLADRFDAEEEPEVNKRYNAAPTQRLPIVVNENGKNKLEVARWGLVPTWSHTDKLKFSTFNARSESVFDSKLWRTSIYKQRCLVPANGYYEWKRVSGKKGQPYYFTAADQDLFAFAGLWSVYTDTNKNEWQTFTIITTTPNKEAAEVHDRMPVILQPDDEAIWLNLEIQDRSTIEACLRMYPNGKLKKIATGTDVNVTKNDNETLIYPMNSK